MARPKTKDELFEAAGTNYEVLWQIINSMPENALNTQFDFSSDLKKKEAHWRRDKDLRDVLIHLYEWHQLLLRWILSNQAGNKSAFIPKPYNFKTYGEMNIAFWKKHQNTQLEDAKIQFKASHKAVLKLVKTFSDEQLFIKKYFDWTGTTSLGSYCVSAMPSHYDWAIKKLRAHIKKFLDN